MPWANIVTSISCQKPKGDFFIEQPMSELGEVKWWCTRIIKKFSGFPNLKIQNKSGGWKFLHFIVSGRYRIYKLLKTENEDDFS